MNGCEFACPGVKRPKFGSPVLDFPTMTEEPTRRPGIKLMLIGCAIMAAGLAGLIALPPGSYNTAVLMLLLLAIVGGGVVCITGSIKRIIHIYKTHGLLGIKARE